MIIVSNVIDDVRAAQMMFMTLTYLDFVH